MIAAAVACTAAQLHASRAGSNGSAGTAYVAYAIRNDGDPCTLYGYPQVRFVGLRGRPRVPVHRDGKEVLPGPAPRVIRLGHGSRAGLVLAFADATGPKLPGWSARSIEIRIGRHWLRLGALRGAADLWESPFLARVPHV